MMGSKSRARGEAFEEQLEYLHNQYRAQERAVVEFMGTRCRPARGRGRLRWIAMKSMPDYVGALVPSGRLLMFDAKSVSNKRSWNLSKDQHHQRDIMSRFAVSALCFFLIEATEHDRLYVLRVRPGRTFPGDPLPKLIFDYHRPEENPDRERVLVVESDGITPPDYLAEIERCWL